MKVDKTNLDWTATEFYTRQAFKKTKIKYSIRNYRKRNRHRQNDMLEDEIGSGNFNKYLIYIPIVLTLVFTNCTPKTCECPLNEVTQLENEYLVNKQKAIWKGQSTSYWKLYDEPFLFDLSHKSYRFRDEDWMNAKDKIYRISKNKFSYYLFYKEFTDETEHLNEFGTPDSLINYYEIQLDDHIVGKLDSLFESSCFWTYPIQKPEANRIILHSKMRFIEVFDPNENACTHKKYHFVDMLELVSDNEEFEKIIIAFEEIVQKHIADS